MRSTLRTTSRHRRTTSSHEPRSQLQAASPARSVRRRSRSEIAATLVTTGDHDDRVVPAHSHKFTATLQAAQVENGPPILTRIEVRAGHGAGKPITKQIDESADVLAFSMYLLGMER